MIQNLKNFLIGANNKEFATKNGTRMHTCMQHVVVDNGVCRGDTKIVAIIQNRPDLMPFFCVKAKTEIPIAGYINGRFISRRIDRLVVNDIAKTVDFMDYKTDANKTEFIERYKKQLNEYSKLLQSAYPDYKISGYILWLHDWELNRII